MTTHRFRSRIDPLIAIVFAAPIVLTGYVFLSTQGPGFGMTLSGMLPLLLVVALPVWIVLDTWYEITETELRVRGGPVRLTVPLARVRAVRRTNTLLAAPALSMRRLAIDYGTGATAVISPVREAEFLALLQARVPAVDLSGLSS